MIARLSYLPDHIAFHSLGIEGFDVLRLLPEERSLLSEKASEKRRIEFTLGRLAARAALLSLGFEESFPLLRGEGGDVLWPDGFTGSISHSSSSAAAIVASKEHVSGLGLDIEKLSPEKDIKIFDRIMLPVECAWVYEFKESVYERALKIFSVKEACFKAFYSATSVRLRYHDVVLNWEEENHGFFGILLVDIPDFKVKHRFYCRCEVMGQFIVSSMSLP